MSRPISFYRLFRGKVWHVGFAQDAAACGSERPVDAETVGERAPANARVCGDCVTAALHLYSLAQSAQMGDPRHPRNRKYPVPPPAEPTGQGQSYAPLALIQKGTAEELVLLGCDWPCGNCGHSSLDHDYDDGSCTVTSDDPAVEWAECPCLTLTPGGLTDG